MTAVQVHGAERVAVTGIRVHIGDGGWIGVQPGSVAGVCMVLVVVVTEVLDAGLGLMPAVRRHGRPAELERQKGEQDDGKNSAHRQESSGYVAPRDMWSSTPPSARLLDSAVVDTT